VEVVSIVGRFLEHARILYFRNDEAPEFYIGSADWMKRNLESRVECMVPVESPTHQRELMYILEEQLGDEQDAWEMRSDGSYDQRSGDPERSAQVRLARHAEKRLRRVRRLQKKKPRSGRKRRK
jgi:polyphosphate kinase